MPRLLRPLTARFALALCAGLVASAATSPVAHASKACKSYLIDSGKLTGLVVTGDGCTTARRVQLRYNACLINSRPQLQCRRKVAGFTCSERNRIRSPRRSSGDVTCRRARKTVRYSYMYWFGPR